MNRLARILTLCLISPTLVNWSYSIAKADIILTTSTVSDADLDFDGSEAETFGDLGIASRTFILTGASLPTAAGFENITSITVEFLAAPGTRLSAGGSGIEPDGIGMTFTGESGVGEIHSLSDGVGEVLTINVSSTSSLPGTEVYLTGVQFNSWRNLFPVSEVTLSGATFQGGLSTLRGAVDVVPQITFDHGVSSFSLESTGTDPIRLSAIQLGVSAVPEPSACLLVTLGFLLVAIGRRRFSRATAETSRST